jgi:hypothetical protein
MKVHPFGYQFINTASAHNTLTPRDSFVHKQKVQGQGQTATYSLLSPTVILAKV